MRGKFAGLGFDPAPGNAGDVRAAADAMAGAGDRLAGSPGSLRSVLTAGDWQGACAEGFAAVGAPVPGALETAHGELRAASQALHTWHGQLLVNQHAAERLDKTAKQLRTEIGEAEREVLAADTRLAATTGPHRSQAEAALHGAQQHLATLRTRLATTLRAAHRLARRHLREADTAAAVLRGTPPSTSWPVAAGDGVATGVGGTSAWTGQVATITLPGETDPVVALPLGAQPGDAGWPVLPIAPATSAPIDPADFPADPTGLTGAAAAPVSPIAPVSGIPVDSATVRPGVETTRPAAAVLAPPVPEPVAAIADHRPTTTHHQEPAVTRVVTTPAHAVRTTVRDAVPSTPVHRPSAATRTYEAVRSSEPVHHVAPADPAPARRPAHQTPDRQPADHGGGRTPDRQPHHGGNPASAEPHPIRPTPPATAATATPATATALGHTATPATPAPLATTTAETATVAPPPSDTASGASPATPPNPAPNPTPSPTPSAAPSTGQPSQQAPHEPAPHHLAAAPGQQVAADQGKSASQPSGQGTPQITDHRREAGPLPDALLAAEPAPGDYTGVVLPAPPQWDGTSVAPLRDAGLLPGTEDGLWATFVIAAALGPALIAESLASGRQRNRDGGRRPGKANRMRAFVLQPGGEQLVMLTLQARGADGWATRRALFLRAVAQYRRPAEVTAGPSSP
ncbi:hypothetical protein [Labedaea rhizosphaerae]|uniref:Uncharacterized protein n=1 Tax=Labedaea rhizosphaerae TaxID=598644 RepID=A0A4R6SC82_LABRH|nr:hypothetical protein [Labedaea rhizosphaerae]TDP97570.1 hypothetical protein EV186_103534 [Labedaea rhizosphaerae]